MQEEDLQAERGEHKSIASGQAERGGTEWSEKEGYDEHCQQAPATAKSRRGFICRKVTDGRACKSVCFALEYHEWPKHESIRKHRAGVDREYNVRI